jgi:ribokinase
LIIVFGALNVDIVMPVKEFPKPGETIVSEDYISRSGGKGSNQAMAAGRAGVKTAMVGKVGDDAFGRRCLNNLKSQSVLGTGIAISDRPTGCATIWVDHAGENMVVVSAGANLDASAEQIPDEILTEKNMVLTQLEVPHDETYTLLRRAGEKGCRTVLNASPVTAAIPTDVLKILDVLIVNDVEAKQLAHHHKLAAKTLEDIARELVDKGENLTCIVTMGAKGALAVTPEEEWVVPSLKVDVVDTTGAGDCFCGVFAASLEDGDTLPDSLKRASVAAGLSCRVLGAQAGMPFEDEIAAHMGDLSAPQQL